MNKAIIVAIIMAILILLFIGWINGFPWEHIIATNRAKTYVIEKYQLTPIGAKYHLSVADGSQRVELYTKEWDFSFDVYSRLRN